MADLRERLKALEQEWRELPKHYMLRAHLTADQVAAILAESEPGCEVCAERAEVSEESARFLSDVEEGKRLLVASLPLGHEFKAPSEGHVAEGMCLSPDGCHRIGALGLCGQPRSAHEPR